jgi:taurine dioxygenase
VMDKLCITPLTRSFGAEVGGIDLSSDLSEDTVESLYRAMVVFGVLVFRKQLLSPQAQCALGRKFGDPVVPVSVYQETENVREVTILHADVESPPDTNVWHVDSSFRKSPPFATILSSVRVPPSGGDTLFADMRSAWKSLPAGFREVIRNLSAVHDTGDLANHFRGSDHDADTLIEGLVRHGAAIHPLVLAHPYSGEKALYVNETYTRHVLGLNAAESRRTLNYLFDFINTPELHYRHRWETDMVLLWDNRLVQHYAIADYLPGSRTMHRLTIENDIRVVNDVAGHD